MSCFWGHKWKVVGFEHGEINKFSPLMQTVRSGGDGTNIKKRCQVCGNIETELKPGHWTAKELGMED